MRALQFITDHVIFKLRYNQIYQMKTAEVDKLGETQIWQQSRSIFNVKNHLNLCENIYINLGFFFDPRSVTHCPKHIGGPGSRGPYFDK